MGDNDSLQLTLLKGSLFLTACLLSVVIVTIIVRILLLIIVLHVEFHRVFMAIGIFLALFLESILDLFLMIFLVLTLRTFLALSRTNVLILSRKLPIRNPRQEALDLMLRRPRMHSCQTGLVTNLLNHLLAKILSITHSRLHALPRQLAALLRLDPRLRLGTVRLGLSKNLGDSILGQSGRAVF